MGFKYFFGSAVLALPWLIVAAPGPVAQLGAWGAAALVLGGLLIFRCARAWPRSLLWAAGLSLVLAWVQYLGFAAAFSPWLAQAKVRQGLVTQLEASQVTLPLIRQCRCV
jgi:hypothetical protein